MNTIYTAGYSTKTEGEFAEMLENIGIGTAVDIRSSRSAANKHFNTKIFGDILSKKQINFFWNEKLGGHRGQSKGTAFAVNNYWKHPSFHNYADYAMSGDFREGLDDLMEVSGSGKTVIFCCEGVWWRCHRRIVSDYLIAHGIEVQHIFSEKVIKKAEITHEAEITNIGGGIILTYKGSQPELF